VSKLLRGRPALVFLSLLCGATTTFAAEVIHSFDSTVRVAKDGELTVTEAIRVQAEGREIRHGIYRDFPLTFKDAGGKVREVDFKLLGVERDGRPERYSTTRQHGVIRIYTSRAASTRMSFATGRDDRSAGSTAGPNSTGTSPGISGTFRFWP